MAASIKEFGFKVPIVVDKDNVIIAGHTRLKAAQKLGLEEVPVIVADDLTPEQVRAFRLADNKVGEIAEWDFEKLEEELKHIAIDLSNFGFDRPMETIEEISEDDFDVEEALKEPPKAKRGDIWTLGEHRLMCGDATEAADLERLMDGSEAALMVTDPPYNMNYEGAGGTSDRKRAENKILNDKMSGGDFRNFLAKFYASALSALEEGASFYVFYKELGEGVFISELEKSGLTFKQELVWVKNQIVLGGSRYQNMYEPCLFGCKGNSPKVWNGGRKERSVMETHLNDIEVREAYERLLRELDTDVVREKKNLVNDLHPTMKPVKLLARFIRNSSNPGEAVYDPFCGSGSTLIACEQLGRKCYAMELDPKYCDVIFARWEKLTGKKASTN